MNANPPNPKRLPVLVDLKTQERTVLDGTEFHIGRAPSNNIVIPEDAYASGMHARIYWEEGSWWVEDLKSSNGTFVDDKMIEQAQKLRPGNVLKFGRSKFRIE
jgi:pSer/pThr/pTyr-binding forkhead associated (FHA) protein